MKSSRTHFIIALGLLLATLALYSFWYGTIVAGSAVAASIEARIQEKTELAARVAAARAALVALAGDEQAVGRYFVSETGVVAFIDDLEARGRVQGGSVSVHSVATTTEEAHPALAVGLSVEGPFESVIRTVGTIEYAPKYLRIADLALTHAGEAWRADLSIVVGSN